MSKPIKFKGRLNRRGRKMTKRAIIALARAVAAAVPEPRKWFDLRPGSMHPGPPGYLSSTGHWVVEKDPRGVDNG